jgi:hypothetical protein
MVFPLTSVFQIKVTRLERDHDLIIVPAQIRFGLVTGFRIDLIP